MKKILFMCLIMGLLVTVSGCGKTERKTTVESEEKKYKYTTSCTLFEHLDNNKDNIDYIYRVIEISYNSDDDHRILFFDYKSMVFDYYTDAKNYYDKNKNSKEWKNIMHELSEGEESSFVKIYTFTEEDHKKTAKGIISEQKKLGYECDTKKNS